MKFRKKPVVIDAMQWDGTNIKAIHDFMGTTDVSYNTFSGTAYIPTLEGLMSASKKDWIIRGVKGEFYPCKPDIFAATYEPVAEGEELTR